MTAQAKQAAGRAAVAQVEDGMRLGFGTGTTVAWFLEALAASGLDVAGVPTSVATESRCRELGLRLLAPHEVDRLDLAVDGADELDSKLTLTKGGGGALVREKVVAAMAARFVVVATPDKVVNRLADSFPLPVEVVGFAAEPVRRAIRDRGFEVVTRLGPDGEPVQTDNRNLLLDCRFPGGLEDPASTDTTLTLLPGVVDTGLFVGMADLALLGRDDGSVEERRPAP